nr:unnamed protein product [Callosobruchus chinensis]
MPISYTTSCREYISEGIGRKPLVLPPHRSVVFWFRSRREIEIDQILQESAKQLKVTKIVNKRISVMRSGNFRSPLKTKLGAKLSGRALSAPKTHHKQMMNRSKGRSQDLRRVEKRQRKYVY